MSTGLIIIAVYVVAAIISAIAWYIQDQDDIDRIDVGVLVALAAVATIWPATWVIRYVNGRRNA